jgi:hypothetical protein
LTKVGYGNGGHYFTIITYLSHSHWVLAWMWLITFWSFHLCMAMAFPKMRTFILTWSWCRKCRNLSPGLAIKAKVCKVTDQEGSLGVTYRAPRNAKDCQGMNLHTPKWTPIVGIGVPNGPSNLQRMMVRVKTHRFEEFFISVESYWNINV